MISDPIHARAAALTLSPAELDALDELFASAAFLVPELQGLRALVDEAPPLSVDVSDGGALVHRRLAACWCPVGEVGLRTLREMAQSVLFDSGTRADIEAVARRALATGPIPEGDIDVNGFEVVHWVRAVDSVSDPAKECRLEDARALAPDVVPGEEVGLPLEDVSDDLLRVVLVALRAARPLEHGSGPEPGDRVASALRAESARTGRSEDEILIDIERQLTIRSTHDYDREVRLVVRDDGTLGQVRAVEAVAEATPSDADRCLASEVDQPPGTIVGFDRGPVDPVLVAAKLERAILYFADEHYDEEPTSLHTLVPVGPDLVAPIVQRMRAAASIVPVAGVRGAARRFDDYRFAAPFEALDTRARVRAIRALGQVRWDDPMWQETLAELCDLVDSGVDPSPHAESMLSRMDPGATDRIGLLLYLGDLGSLPHGQRFSAVFSQDPVGVDVVTRALAVLDDAQIEALLDG